MSPRSAEFLQAAERRLTLARTAGQDPAGALSAAYYAMLYAARAALSEQDITLKPTLALGTSFAACSCRPYSTLGSSRTLSACRPNASRPTTTHGPHQRRKRGEWLVSLRTS